MALFDKIGKTFTEAGQKAIAKTKDFADTTRLNSLINDEEKKLTNLYIQIGKLYVAQHRNDCEEAFAGALAAVAESEEKIAECQRRIQEIRRVQRCPKCGAEVSNDSAFCNSCGSPLPKNKDGFEEFIVCSGCGARVQKGMRFCTTCGKPIQALQGSSVSEKTCPTCGTSVDGDLLFCPQCGSKL